MPNFIEVCSGAGGLSTGLIQAGFECILLNDNSKECCKTLQINHKNVDVQCCNMSDIKINPDIKIDLLCGGVPCQSFSQAGNRKGLDDPRGNLILEFEKLINKINPKVFLIENVKGLITHNGGKTLDKIIKLLNSSNNYNIKFEVLNAVNYSVPQKRERIFIIGVSKVLNKEFYFPPKNKKIKNLEDVLKNVPESPCAKYSLYKQNLFNKIPQGGCWTSLSEEEQKTYMKSSYNSEGGKRGILKRLDMKKPSLTILCSPSQKQTERCHPLYSRPLSIRESARIQTFPDEYIFTGSISAQYKMIGNAVPVKLARQLGLQILNLFM